MAEFTEVVRQLNRMCEQYENCSSGCPLYKTTGIYQLQMPCYKFITETEHAADAERAIMDWAAAHPEKPKKTRIDVLAERFPNYARHEDGTPHGCAYNLGIAPDCKSSDECANCWRDPAPDEYQEEG